MGYLWFVLIGAVAGWLAGQFMRGNGFGLLGDIIVGVIGSFLGGVVVREGGAEGRGPAAAGSEPPSSPSSAPCSSSSSPVSSPAAGPDAGCGLERSQDRRDSPDRGRHRWTPLRQVHVHAGDPRGEARTARPLRQGEEDGEH